MSTDENQTGRAADGPAIDFQALVSVLHEGIWVIDVDGITLFANPRMAEMLGTTPEAMIDRSVLDFFAEQDHVLLMERMRSRRTGTSDDYLARLRRADGSLIHVQVHGSPLLRDGSVLGSVAAVTDVSELHEQLADANVALEAADAARQARTRLMSWVAHELRTPLNTISGFAQLLRASALPPADHDMVANILTASTHVNDLVQDLLDYTRADSATIETTTSPVSLREVVEEAASLVAVAAEEHRVRFDRDVPDLWAAADRRRLVGVLVNLMSNAVKYGGDGKIVTVRAHAAGDRVRVDVVDQGPGITPLHQRTIFQPFERLDNADGIHGTGLGLAIADAFVRAMHGTLSLESTPGSGTSFTIDLPTADRPDEQTATPNASIGSGRQQTVLYVEDEPLNASLLESIVSLLPGRSLHVEPTVAQGIQAAARLHPRLVLLDLNLPDGSGFDVLAAVRADPATSATPVFILSADATEQSTKEALERGADRFITKPFDLEQFLALLDEHTK